VQEIIDQFIAGLRQTTLLEFVAVIAGIASVFFSRKENILVYPVGLVNTVIYIYLSVKGHLYGEASVNFYYTVMSIYGWIIWAKRDQQHEHAHHE
jgi:nicotinamide mononucleotide transporter